MPRGDRTGPMGLGPMTGRAAGYCAGFGMPGYANPLPGRGYGMGHGRGYGMGRGRGFGRGLGRAYFAAGMPGWTGYGAAPFPAPDAASEKEYLGARTEALQAEIDALRKRMNELESEEKKA